MAEVRKPLTERGFFAPISLACPRAEKHAVGRPEEAVECAGKDLCGAS